MKKIHTLSRFIIFLPLVIVFFAVYMKYSTPNRLAINPVGMPQISPAEEKKSSLLDLMKSTSGEANIDITGSYKCEYKKDTKTVDVFIKNKNVSVQFAVNNRTDFALINGDCGYKWQKGEFSGMKMCGVSEIISIYESLSSLPFMGSEALFTMLDKINPSATLTLEEITAIKNSCEKTVVADTVFTVPSNITFKDNGSFTSTAAE